MKICGIVGPVEILVILAEVVLIFGSTLVALIDVLRSEFTENHKLIWILVILFLGPIGAILYYLIGKQHKIKQHLIMANPHLQKPASIMFY